MVTVGSKSSASLRQPEASLQEACVLSKHWREPGVITPACNPKHLGVRGWKMLFLQGADKVCVKDMNEDGEIDLKLVNECCNM